MGVDKRPKPEAEAINEAEKRNFMVTSRGESERIQSGAVRSKKMKRTITVPRSRLWHPAVAICDFDSPISTVSKKR